MNPNRGQKMDNEKLQQLREELNKPKPKLDGYVMDLFVQLCWEEYVKYCKKKEEEKKQDTH